MRAGLEVGAAPADPVKILFPGPAAGSSPEQIVQGFLRAGAASDEEYEVARSFLALSSDTTWRPDSSIMVFTDESAVSVKAVDDNTVRATAKVSASIDANGRYRDLPADTTVEVVFRLQKSSGEWRISSVPEGFGLWLSASDVDRLYEPFRIHYVSTFDRSARARRPLVLRGEGAGHAPGPRPAGLAPGLPAGERHGATSPWALA